MHMYILTAFEAGLVIELASCHHLLREVDSLVTLVTFVTSTPLRHFEILKKRSETLNVVRSSLIV